MMFSNFFGKKPEGSAPKRKFFPQNRLEALLMQAARDPSTRPEFYKELLAADLYVLIVPGDRPDGKFVAQPGERLSIKGITVEGRMLIPVFTSELRLREYIQGPDHLAKLNGRALLSMISAREEGVVLNPASNYGREFTKDEIKSLADGSIFTTKTQIIEKETKVLIAAPKEYPAKAVEALIKYFQSAPQVKKAYVAQIHIPESGEPPHLIFAIQAEGNIDSIVSDLNVIFRETLNPGQYADLMQLGQGGLDDYFAAQQPFFER